MDFFLDRKGDQSPQQLAGLFYRNSQESSLLGPTLGLWELGRTAQRLSHLSCLFMEDLLALQNMSSLCCPPSPTKIQHTDFLRVRDKAKFVKYLSI